MNIVHITSVHRRKDSRIFYKECISLKNAGHNVTLLVADGLGNEQIEGINILDVGLQPSRIRHLLISSKQIVDKALQLNADIYHFHDPDLLIQIRRLAKNHKVIFDSHEDFPKLMLQRDYIPHFLRKILFHLARYIEKKTYKKLSAVVTSTDNIRNKFLSYGHYKTVISVKNFPIVDIYAQNTEKTFNSEPFSAVYVGGLTKIRGVEQMIRACEMANVPLILAGVFDNPTFEAQMRALNGWKNVEYLGFLPHKELENKVYNRGQIGLNMLLSAPNHTHSIPIKQLEYMAFGLATISSRHILFCDEVVKHTKCGVLVEPEDVKQCAEEIIYLKNHPNEAMKMGKNGKDAVIKTYNWHKEEQKLIKLYEELG